MQISGMNVFALSTESVVEHRGEKKGENYVYTFFFLNHQTLLTMLNERILTIFLMKM